MSFQQVCRPCQVNRYANRPIRNLLWRLKHKCFVFVYIVFVRVYGCVYVKRESGERETESEKRVREEKCESEIMWVCKFTCKRVYFVCVMFAKQLQNSKRINFKGEFNSIQFNFVCVGWRARAKAKANNSIIVIISLKSIKCPNRIVN